MSTQRDPHVWLDGEADDFEATLLASARRDGMSPDKKRALAAAMVVGAGMTATKGALAAKAGAEKAGLVATGAKALVVVAASTALFFALTPATAPSLSRAVPPRHLPPPTTLASTASPISIPTPVAIPSTSAAALPSALPSALPNAPPARPAPSLADELRLLGRARDALAHGDHAAATAALDEHARVSPAGTFRDEARVLRIDLLARSGDHDRARSQARAYLAAHPSSPHAPRLRELLTSLGDDSP